MNPDSAAALDALDTHATENRHATHECRRPPTFRRIASRTRDCKLATQIGNTLTDVDDRVAYVQSIDVVDQHWSTNRSLQDDVGNLVECGLFIRVGEPVTFIELHRDKRGLAVSMNTLVVRRIERAVDQ